ncbi:ABC transporter permease subunit [Halorhabdus sp. CBA1104]|uniref:ABC transporter permease n=1 Tax=Halorhabdus sp. CBA1104 TaxID=1380432 RepID=UPI0012B440FC|nr:ABC transporter permease [Halorhabdus sp. CBA1104]QGN07744.1 ABC transporter permease subunit [Halorhabdus sp. CBA1104]
MSEDTRAEETLTDRPVPTLGATSQWTVLALLGAVLALYLVGPFLAFLLENGLPAPSAFAEPAVGAAITASVVTAPVATLLATVFGVPLAYVLARYSFRGKRLLDALVVLPLAMPPVVGGVVLLSAFGRLSAVGGLAAAIGVPLTEGYLGVILAQTFVAAPFLVVTARSGFAAVDRDLERAARNLGNGPLATFFRVSLPLARGSIVAGIVLTFARALGEFGATMLLGHPPETMPTRIWVEFVSGGTEATVPLVVALLAAGLTVVFVLQLLGESLEVSP